jgi:hypothetical protein
MSYAVWFKAGCETQRIAPSGLRILAAIERCAQTFTHDVVITCGSDSHPPENAHSKGQAFDVRSHDMGTAQKHSFLLAMMDLLSEGPTDPPVAKDGGFVTKHFFGWLEHPGAPTEHFHFQQRKAVPFP